MLAVYVGSCARSSQVLTDSHSSPLSPLPTGRPPAMVGVAFLLAVLATVASETGPLKYDLEECAAASTPPHPLGPGTCAGPHRAGCAAR